MAIYRGAGGAGDATGDSASEALLVRQLATEVQADADAAEAARVAAVAAKVAAETAETNAETAETNAETAATNAASSASSAASSASTATTQATNASNSASAASTSATNAASSASSASTSASNAATSATNAASSASSASTSATNAAAAQTAAESARDATLAAYDSFDDRYLGAKISDPVLDNDGNALQAGELYFNTVSGVMKVYTGTVWVDAYAAGDTFLAKANNLSDLPSASTARTNLGLGTAATTDSSAYATAAQGAKADTALQSYTETDPVFSASEAATITSTDTSHWDTAYGWGNHASAGYLTSIADGSITPAKLSTGHPTWDTSGNLTLDNGSADGAQLVLKSSGYSDWNIDNYSGSLRAYYGASERMRIDSSGNVKLSTAGTKILNSSGTPILNQTGSVLQVVTYTTNTNFSTASSTPADTQLSATITPSSTTSKILVLVHHADAGKAENAINGSVRLVRGSTTIFNPSYTIGRTDTTATNFSGGFDFHYLDSPSTTSAVTYKTQAWTAENTTRFYLGLLSAQHSITLLEIAG